MLKNNSFAETGLCITCFRYSIKKDISDLGLLTLNVFFGDIQALLKGQDEQFLLQLELLFIFLVFLFITMAMMRRTTARTNNMGITIGNMFSKIFVFIL